MLSLRDVNSVLEFRVENVESARLQQRSSIGIDHVVLEIHEPRRTAML